MSGTVVEKYRSWYNKRTRFYKHTLSLESRIQLIFEEKEIIEPRHDISNYVVCAISKASDQPAQCAV